MKLSIITVNLNNKDGLQKTIDSIISQTFKDFEWIVIDGGSTDGSKELIEMYSEYISYWVSEPDKGIYNAMNKGIRVAKGEYLQFLNSGDSLYSHDVLSLVFSSGPTEDIILGNIISDGKIIRGIGSRHSISLLDFYYSSVLHPSSYSKRDLFERYGYFDETLKICSDWKFFILAMILHNASVRYIDKTLVNFDSSGISSKVENVQRIRTEKTKVLKELIPERILSNYVFLQNESIICRYRLTKYCYALLLKAASMYKKTFNCETDIL